jgi:C4-dicarboxylate transporter DctM subunit
MSLFLLFAVMLACMALGMNIGLAMIASSLAYLIAHSGDQTGLPLAILPMKMLYGVDSFPLLAVPLFMLAGELMSAGGIMTRIVRFATALVGWITGGLAHVNIVVNMIMAGMSGSAVADAAATGSVLIPAMVRVGFSGAFAAAVTAAAATIGPIIPPSIPFVLIGSIAQVSIGRLFLGGAVPGIVMGLFLMATAYWVAKRHGYAVEKRASLRELAQSFWSATPALLMPLIVMGGIFSGITTPTEAAVLAVTYALFLSVVVYRQLGLRDCYRICVGMGSSTAAIMLTISGATLLGFIATAEQMGPKLMLVFLSFSDNPVIILLVVNLALLVLGCVMEPVPIILLTVPIFFPALTKIGIDPVHLGVVMTLNLMIGLLTPFVGLNLFITSAIARVPIIAVAHESLIFIATLIVVLLLITLFPPMVTWLPNHVMGG